MQMHIAPDIFQDFPEAHVGCLVLHGYNGCSKTAIDDIIQATQKLVHENVTSAELIKQHPVITSWHNAYRAFGAKPKKHTVSLESLLSHVVAGDDMRVNPLVDLYNAISLAYLLPARAFDLDAVNGDITLRKAGDDEASVTLLGEKTPRAPQAGEVIYADQNGAICRRWNWKASDRTKIADNTRNVVFVFEILDAQRVPALSSALHQLAQYLTKICSGDVSTFMLSSDQPSIAVTDASGNVVQHRAQQHEELDHLPIEDFQYAISYQQSLQTASQEYQVRVHKVQALRERGIEPWPPVKPVSTTARNIIQEYETSREEKRYTVSGRLMSIRLHGKTAFATLQDRSGSIQVYLKQDTLGKDRFELFTQYFDLGDIMWVQGTVFTTKMGEVTLHVTDFTMQSKCLRPLPEKYHGLSDVETKYRQRYLDLMTNASTRERFKKRSKAIEFIRSYLNNHGFLEVETPMLHPIPGGASARPFVTHHNALDSELYMRVAPELYLKRLVVGGLERVYELNKSFRNEGLSPRHNPEFTMLELYMAYQDYQSAMDFVETMLKRIVYNVSTESKLTFGEHTIDMKLPFDRMSPYQALIQFARLSEDELSEDAIDDTCQRYNISFEKHHVPYYEKVLGMYEELAEPNIIQPTFIVHFPIEVSPLAKRDRHDPQIAARFELIIGGLEVSHGYNELNDPFDQAARFKEQAQQHASGQEEAMHYDADFIRALEYGLPPTAGVGVGIDRLIMILTNASSIKDVILFPTLRRKIEQS